jgi:hypothetical protein
MMPSLVGMACASSRGAAAPSLDSGGTVVPGDGGPVSGPPRTLDPNGWTVITPSSDSRIIYVSSTDGDDSNGAFVLGTDIPPGQTAQTQPPPSAVPFKTITTAKSLLRPGYPDWLLLKAGDVWVEDIGQISDSGGRSQTEPRVFSSYGTGPRPQLQPTPGDIAGTSKSNGSIWHIGSTLAAHIYFIGLEFYNPTRDPDNPAFNPTGHDITTVSWLDSGNDVLFEDCLEHFMGSGICVGAASHLNPGLAPTNFTMRRCIEVDNYSLVGHGQGSYFDTVDGAIIEENVFDHNAWNDAAGVPAGIFNHHLYFFNQTNTTIQRNLFLRAESLATKCVSRGLDNVRNVTYDNNLYFEGEVGISVGYQDSDTGNAVPPAGGSCINGLNITNNVFLQVNRDNPTGRGLGWGIDLKSVANAELSGNIFSDFSFTGNTYAIYLESGGQTTSTSSNVTIERNTLYKINIQNIVLSPQAGWSNIRIRNNTLQDGGLGAAMQSLTGTFSPLTYSGNTYSASDPANFSLVNNVQQDYDEWLVVSREADSIPETVAYPNPGVNLDTYMAKFSLGLADLYAAVRKQSKATWNPAFTATAINNYIRNEGFGLSPL